MTALRRRFPRPVTGDQIRAVPLRSLARPAPIGVGSVRVVPEAVVQRPSRVLAGAWPTIGDVVACGVCGAPVLARTVGETVDALLGDVDPPLPVHACLWCGPAGVARTHPPVAPVDVCVLPAAPDV